MKRYIFILLAILFAGFLVSAAATTTSPATSSTLSSAQESVYNLATNPNIPAPSLKDTSAEDLTKIMKSKAGDPKYAYFIDHMGEADFDRALEKEPSIITTENTIKTNGITSTTTPIMGRLEAKITSEPQYINRGNKLTGVATLGQGTDRRALKKEWLKSKGFDDGNGVSWDGVDIKSYNNVSGILELDNGEERSTKINTTSTAKAMRGGDYTGFSLTDGGALRTDNGIEISGGEISVVNNAGDFKYTIKENGDNFPIVDLGDFDPNAPGAGPANIKIDNAPGTKIIDDNGYLGAEQLIAEDTSFNVKTLGNGGVEIGSIGSGSKVAVYNNIPGLQGDKKLMDISSGGVKVDYKNSVCEFQTQSDVSAYDSSRNKVFDTTIIGGDILTTKTLSEMKDYARQTGAVLAVEDLDLDNVVSLRDGILSGPKVTVKTSSNGPGEGDDLYSLELNNFQNGIYFKSDFTGNNYGKITQTIADTAGNGLGNVQIVHVAQEGIRTSALSGNFRAFNGVSESLLKNGKGSKLAFDNGYIFGIGKDEVSLQQLERGDKTSLFPWSVTSTTGRWDYAQPSAGTSGTTPASPAVSPENYFSIAAPAMVARKEGLIEQFIPTREVSGEVSLNSVGEFSKLVEGWGAMLSSSFDKTAEKTKKCKEKLGSTYSWDETTSKCIKR